MADPNINDQVEAALESLGIDPDSIVLPGGGTVANASKESLNSAGLAQSVTPTDVTSGAAAASGGSSNIGSELLAAPGMISSTSSMFKGTTVDPLATLKNTVQGNLQQLNVSTQNNTLASAVKTDTTRYTIDEKSLDTINERLADDRDIMSDSASVGINEGKQATADLQQLAQIKNDPTGFSQGYINNLISKANKESSDALSADSTFKAADAETTNLTKQASQLGAQTNLEGVQLASDQSALTTVFPSTGTISDGMGGFLPSAPIPSQAQAQSWLNDAQKSLTDTTNNQKAPTSLLGKINSKINQILKNPYVAGLAAAGLGFTFFLSAESVFKKFSIGGLTGLVSSFAGFWKAMSALHNFFGSSSYTSLNNLFFHLTSGPGILIIAGALLLLAFLLTSKPNTTPSAVEEPLVTMPTVWTSKAVVFMTAGIAMSTLGILTGPTAPLTQTLTIPAIALTTALNSSQLTDSSGNAVGSGAYSLYNTVFVQSGTGNNPDEAIYVTQGTNGQAIVSAVTLKSGLKFSAPSSPQAAYINFVQTNSNGTWSANPQVVQALNAQNALTATANAVNGVSGSNAIQLAGASNKTATPSSTGH